MADDKMPTEAGLYWSRSKHVKNDQWSVRRVTVIGWDGSRVVLAVQNFGDSEDDHPSMYEWGPKVSPILGERADVAVDPAISLALKMGQTVELSEPMKFRHVNERCRQLLDVSDEIRLTLLAARLIVDLQDAVNRNLGVEMDLAKPIPGVHYDPALCETLSAAISVILDRARKVALVAAGIPELKYVPEDLRTVCEQLRVVSNKMRASEKGT
ncbi:hypothetical protein HDIA_0740 [Hartmannibacter diazotrophicus]|uniref:Uncharacterized protein n=1 Tax=Hartmannibacter diazotrophicus TaxID=1482074 RepID=A0A2C9D3B9_9HYPH|nr:hypothetical protein [Hartmannibacter diazotrophicus]SON54281.1 hypothetical protein HDIA_0740 [Hartmannibacter diazotrophicus]